MERNLRKTRTGKVVSNKMDKTMHLYMGFSAIFLILSLYISPMIVSISKIETTKIVLNVAVPDIIVLKKPETSLLFVSDSIKSILGVISVLYA